MPSNLRLVHSTHIEHALHRPVIHVPVVVVIIVILARLYPSLEVTLRMAR